MTDVELLAEAGEAATLAYAPYSDLRVGAVVVGKSGQHYRGANVENAAYASGLCAEAIAIGSAIASGEREIAAVAVISPDLKEIHPCGQCRQRMSEFGVERIIVENSTGEPAVYSMDDLLPGGFKDWRGSTST